VSYYYLSYFTAWFLDIKISKKSSYKYVSWWHFLIFSNTLRWTNGRFVLQYTYSYVVWTRWYSITLQLWSVSMAVRKLSWVLDWPWTQSSSLPACTLAWLEYSRFFLWGYLKTKVYASTVNTREGLWHRIKQFASEIKNTTGIFECVWVSFSCRAELCVCEHGSHFL
jgi:hypothetical protein